MLKKLALSFFAFALAATFAACQNASAQIKQATVEETQAAVSDKDVQFIDVRTPDEYAAVRAPKAKLFPLDALEKDLDKLDKAKPVYVICRSGNRSQTASEILEKSGFKEIYNVAGGMIAWTKAGLPTEKP